MGYAWPLRVTRFFYFCLEMIRKIFIRYFSFALWMMKVKRYVSRVHVAWLTVRCPMVNGDCLETNHK